MLARLFDPTQPGGHGIREAYAFDIPNHGESAVFNSGAINLLYGEECMYYSISSSLSTTLTCNILQGPSRIRHWRSTIC
jgi:hypothetical protein